MERIDILFKKEEILKYIEEGRSKHFIRLKLNCTYSTLNKYLKILNIDYKGKQNWRKNISDPKKYIPLSEYLARGGRNTTKIRIKLLQENIKPHKCEKCGNSEWLNKKIPLELHHKDGNHDNINLNNFQLLCPNCHVFTENYKGRKLKRMHYCSSCGKSISRHANMCKKCAYNNSIKRMTYNYTKRPSKETLEKLLFSTKNFCKIARMYNVSDNAVRKWCKFYGLPFRKRDL